MERPFREQYRPKPKPALKRAQSALLDKKRSVLGETSNLGGRLQRKESWAAVRGKMETATTMASKVSGEASGVSIGSGLVVSENYSI